MIENRKLLLFIAIVYIQRLVILMRWILVNVAVKKGYNVVVVVVLDVLDVHVYDKLAKSLFQVRVTFMIIFLNN